MSKVGVFLADGFEEIEGLTVVDLLRRAGIDTVTVSINGSKKVTGSHNIAVEADELITDTKFGELDMLVLPGGMPGTTNLENCELLMKEVDAFHKNGKYISAICAAPGVFGRRGILEGRKATVYPGLEGELRGAEPQTAPTVISDHILTSRGMGTAIAFGLAIVERFQGKEKADELAKKIVYFSDVR